MKLHKIIKLEKSFVLHIRPYKETSLVVDLFTENYGRVSTLAKGAKKPKSSLRAIKIPTSLNYVSFQGKKELKILTHCENIQHYSLSAGLPTNCVIYLNELLIKFLQSEDPHKRIFNEYRMTLDSLGEKHNTEKISNLLRSFELLLLQEVGYGINFGSEAKSGKRISEELLYSFDPMQGFIVSKFSNTSQEYLIKGKDILNFAKGDLSSLDTIRASKHIMRKALDNHLENRTLRAREVLFNKR